MDVILLKKQGKLGDIGEIVTVKDGYAQNYLIPQGLALRASSENHKQLEELKIKKEKLLKKEQEKFLVLKEKIEKTSLTITAQAKDDEELYGSINEAQIIKLLEAENIVFDKEKLLIEEPIKRLGVYNLKVKLHPEVEANLRVWVMKK
tara:strand:+ start:4119 stop:4562 length:444 start_codon:yes stop_codon:yes gene_type:complete